ncbi:MAG TPA: toxin glutamine deamidase domain-containing protein [Mycobacteriales bacterium]|nr:toxin glutamine deamidase domain-containing protein [Mycobacteriales bacterium]
MARREFPALGFDPAPGDAGAVASAAGDVDGAARVFEDASGNVSRLNSSGWTGEAAEAFRGQLKDLPRDLDLAARSHRTTARTLSDYGTGLQARQRRADDLETRAAELRRQQQAAIAEVNRLAGQTAPAGSAALATLRGQYDSARSRADGLGTDLEAVIGDARRLLDEHRGAAGSAARAIRDVADAPYKEPGWLSRAWDSVSSWISEHADVLTQISSVLKGVSAVLGVLSLVPGLQFLAPFALAAAGIALAIDVAVKLATGRGSWAAIGLDAALTFIPGGRILSGLRGARAARAATVVDDLARAPGMAMRGNPVRGLGSTAVHSGNAGNSVVRRLFPELADTNPLFRNNPVTSRFPNAGTAGFRNNCQSCVTAVDNQLAGAPTSAIRRNLGAADDIMASPNWRQNIATVTGTSNTFQSVGSYDDIVRQLQNAGDGSRGIIHGMRTGPGGMSVPGHVFNVVNRNGRVYFLDGQTGTLARLENYSGGMEFLRTF